MNIEVEYTKTGGTYAPLNIRKVWVGGQRVEKLKKPDGTRWIGRVDDLIVKVDGCGYGCNMAQGRTEFTRWQNKIRKSPYVDAFAAIRWYAEVSTDVGTLGVVVQDAIPDPTPVRSTELVKSVVSMFYRAGIRSDVGAHQANTTATTPFGFKIHDYGYNAKNRW